MTCCTVLTPSFQRGWFCGTPRSVVPKNAKLVSTKSFERFGAASRSAFQRRYAFQVGSGVSFTSFATAVM